MSRAFVREDDQGTPELPDRVPSEHPNFVTPRGLALLDARVHELERELELARASQDTDHVARVSRELRYVRLRRGSARQIDPSPEAQQVRFGVRVALRLPDGQVRQLRLVGEDEADAPQGLLSYVSPLAQRLLGLELGDECEYGDGRAEVVGLEP